MKIGIDLDEVLAEFVKGYSELYKQKFGKEILFENWHSYNFWEVIGGTKEEAIKLAEEFYNSDLFENISLIDGAKEAIQQLSKEHELLLITSRPSHLKEKTNNFIKKYFSDSFSAILYAGDFFSGQGKTKAEICKEFGVGLFIDDNKNYAVDCAKNGIKVLLLDKPWNRNSGQHKNVKRVHSWNEILEEVKKIT